ncbi:MAG: hypothetical protein ACOZAN_02950 [Patescibacteria group bacterium]
MPQTSARTSGIGRSRETLATMFNGERPVLSALEHFFLSRIGLNLADITETMSQLPAEMGQYLQANLQVLQENLGLLIDSALEKNAAAELWNRFGEPQIPEAVGVFKTLTLNVMSSLDVLQTVSQECKQQLLVIVKTLEIIQKIVLQEKISRLEKEEKRINTAISELGSLEPETAGQTVVYRSVSGARDRFEQEKHEIKRRLDATMERFNAIGENAYECLRSLGILEMFTNPQMPTLDRSKAIPVNAN